MLEKTRNWVIKLRILQIGGRRLLAKRVLNYCSRLVCFPMANDRLTDHTNTIYLMRLSYKNSLADKLKDEQVISNVKVTIGLDNAILILI